MLSLVTIMRQLFIALDRPQIYCSTTNLSTLVPLIFFPLYISQSAQSGANDAAIVHRAGLSRDCRAADLDSHGVLCYGLLVRR